MIGQSVSVIGPGVLPGQTPQPLSVGDSPSFAGLYVTGLAEGSVVFTGPGGELTVDGFLTYDPVDMRLGVPSLDVYSSYGRSYWEATGRTDIYYMGVPHGATSFYERVSCMDDDVAPTQSAYRQYTIRGRTEDSSVVAVYNVITPYGGARMEHGVEYTNGGVSGDAYFYMSNTFSAAWYFIIDSSLGIQSNSLDINMLGGSAINVGQVGVSTAITLSAADPGFGSLDQVYVFAYDTLDGHVPGFRAEDGTLILLDQSLTRYDDVEFARVASEPISGDMYIEESIMATANAVVATSGTVISGTVVDTRQINATYYQVEEVAATPGFLVDFSFTGITQVPKILHIKGRYQGTVPHLVKLQAWNFNTLAWESLTANANDMPHSTTDVLYAFAFPGALAGTWPTHYVSAGEVRIRFNHTSAGTAGHDLYIDYIAIQQNSIDLTVEGTAYTLIDGMAAGSQDNVTITPASGLATIQVDGKYYLGGHICLAGAANLSIEGHIAINDVLQVSGGFKGTLGADPSKFCNIAFGGYYDLVAGDEVKFKLQGDVAGGWLSVNDYVMLVEYRGK